MFRNRIPLITAAIAGVACVAVVASLAVAAVRVPVAAATGAGSAKIQLRGTGLGKVLVDGRGFTLYAFTRDGKRKDRCAAISGCTNVWPITTTRGRPSAGRGVKRSLLGTIKVHGIAQVTYAGHPLYGYVGDRSPGATGYVGVSQFGGAWPAVRASGSLVR